MWVCIYLCKIKLFWIDNDTLVLSLRQYGSYHLKHVRYLLYYNCLEKALWMRVSYSHCAPHEAEHCFSVSTEVHKFIQYCKICILLYLQFSWNTFICQKECKLTVRFLSEIYPHPDDKLHSRCLTQSSERSELMWAQVPIIVDKNALLFLSPALDELKRHEVFDGWDPVLNRKLFPDLL